MYSGVPAICSDGRALHFGSCGENAVWEMNADGVLTISGTGAMSDFRSASYAEGKVPWYEMEDTITAVVIEEGVTSVGNYSFYDCDALTSVTLPEGLQRIGQRAFCYCDALTSVEIPDGVTCIDEEAFYNCMKLESANVPVSVTEIGNLAFLVCPELTLTYEGNMAQWIALKCNAAPVVCTDGKIAYAGYCGADVVWTLTESGVLTLSGTGATHNYGYVSSAARSPWNAYYDSIKSVVVGEGITRIGDYLFYECSSVTDVTIPVDVTCVNGYAFFGCTALTDVYYGGTADQWSAITLGNYNTALTSATIHYLGALGSGTCGDNLTWELSAAGVLTIGGTGAMTNYGSETPPWYDLSASITSVVIEDEVTTIGDYAFYEHAGLTSVTIPANITSVGENAFGHCPNLTSISVESGNTGYLAVDGVLFTADGKTLLQYPAGKEQTSYSVPDEVIVIGVGAFDGCTKLTSVTISDTVTNIDKWAFFKCTELTGITIPNSLTSIGTRAFLECDKLADVCFDGTEEEWNALQSSISGGNDALKNANITFTIVNPSGTCGDGLTWELADGTLTITGTGALPEYDSENPAPWAGMGGEITSVVIGEGVTKVPGTPFAGCDNLTDVTLQGESTRLEDSVLEDCDKLNSLSGTCGAAVTYVYADGTLTIRGTGPMGKYDYAEHIPWYGIRDKITTAVIEEGVTTVAKNAFNYSTELTSVTLPDGITEIGSHAFDLCSKLTAVTLPDTVTDIGYYAFHSSGLTEITLPAGLKTIGKHAFYDSAIAEITVPASVTSIGDAAFANMRNLTSVSVESGNEAYIAADGVLFTADGKTLLQYPAGKTDEAYEIAAGVTAIGAYAFSSTKLQSVTLPEGMTVIDDYAFYYTRNLTELVVPEGVTTIGDAAFQISQKLKTVTLPASVTSIGSLAFGVCMELTDIYFGGSWLQWNALGVTTDATVHCALVGSGTCGDDLTWELSNDGTLTIRGTGAMTEYSSENPAPWADLADDITSVVIGEGVTSIGGNPFAGCDNLTDVTLQGESTRLEDSVLEDCDKLNSLSGTCGAAVTYVYADGTLTIRGTGAMANYTYHTTPWETVRTSITSVVFEEGITTIGDYACYDSDGVTNVTIPKSVTDIGDRAFGGCDGLIGVILFEGVTNISEYAFGGCTRLTSMILPEGVTNIDKRAFEECRALTNITIPESVTNIGSDAFSMCYELTDVYYGGSESQWSAVTIGDGNTNLTSATMHYGVVETSGTCGDDLTWELSKDGTLTIRGEGKMDDYSDSDAPWAEVGDRIGSVVIEDGVTSIGGGAFQGCDNLTEITIPETVTEIGEDALTDCGNLKDIHFEGSAEQWEEIGGNLEGVEVQVAVAKGTCGSGLSWVLDVKNGTLTISGSGAMSDYTAENAPWAKYSDDITTVVIGSGVTAIGDNAFAGCTALETVAVPKSVKTIGDGAFYDCTALATVHYDHCSAGWDDIAIGADNECLTAATLISIPEPTAAAAPVLLATEIGDGTIAVSWEEIPGVYAYRVYRKAPGSSAWKKCGDTTDSVYVDSVTKNGNYTYTVCCLSSSDKTIGKYDSKGIKTVYYAAPKNAAVTNTADGVKISWKKVSGISKYGVYVETADGWQKIATTSSSSYTYKAAISGESYRLAVTCMNKAGTANYSVYSKAVSITYIAQPKINSMEVTENGLVIRWDDVPGAETYRVLRKSSGKWKTVAETTELSYLQESYKLGSSYTYSVVCIDGPEGAQISTYNKTGETIKPVKAPALKSISNTADGLKLSWGKVSGASKYRVLLLDGTQWVNVGETKSTSYTVKGLDSGKVHTLTVCCISSNGVARASGFDTDGMSLYYLAAPQFTLINTVDGIKVDWESVNGADSYTVLRKSGSKWVVEAEGVTDTEYTYKKASSSKSYTFSLRSEAADGIKSAYNTTGKKLTYIAQPEIKSITNTTSGMKLTWGKVSGASKYRVYLVNEDGSLTKLKDTSSTSYTYTAAENGKNYTFTVVCLNSKSKEVSAYDPHGWMAGFVATPKLTALTNVQDGVKLTWEPVEGATGYQVMRKSGKTWVAEGEPVTDPEYIYTGATSGKSVTLSVKALMDGEESGYHSTGKKLTYIAQPVVTLSETAKGVKLSWKKVGGASKYRVYLVNEDGKLTKLKDTTSTSYTYTKIEEGKSYKFTVACLNSSGKIIGSYNADGWNYPLPE